MNVDICQYYKKHSENITYLLGNTYFIVKNLTDIQIKDELKRLNVYPYYNETWIYIFKNVLNQRRKYKINKIIFDEKKL